LPEAGDHVELALDVVVEEVGRADHRQDFSGLGIDGEEVAVVGAQRVELLLADGNRMLRGLLQLEVEGSGDDEAAAVDGIRPIEILQLLEDEVDEVRRLAAALLFEDEVQRRVLRLVRLRLVDHPLLDHGAQDHRLAGLGAIFVQQRIVIGWSVWQAGEQGGFREVELAGVLAEINLRGGLDAGGMVAVEDAVEVQLKDVILLVSRFQLRRDERFAELYEEAPLRRLQHRNLGQLLGNGARALLRPPGKRIDDAGLHDPEPVNAVVLVEVLVFDGDGGVAQRRADLVEVDRADPSALRVAFFDELTVAIEQFYASGGQVELARIGQRGHRVREAS
jgi:hypothetical protein